jgi:SprT protein
MTFQDFEAGLKNYVPRESLPSLFEIFRQNPAIIKITRPRDTKIGDYRSPFQGKPHRISVNGDLNTFAFLITFLHEYAHLHTWSQFKDDVKPHGEEWKQNFRKLMIPFLKMNIFPPDVEAAVKNYIQNPFAGSCTDVNLLRKLKEYDLKREDTDSVTIEELPLNSLFMWRDGRVFRKMNKVRKRYRCLEVSSKQMYLFNALAEVRFVD